MRTRRDAIIGTTFGIGAGLAYGISWVLIRQGVSGMAPPLVGAAIGVFSGTLGLLVTGGSGIKSGVVNHKKAVVLMFCAGLAAAGGTISSYFALSKAPVVIIGPIQSMHPLFTLLWSWMFLGQMERITPRLVLGSMLVVSGVVLITLSR